MKALTLDFVKNFCNKKGGKCLSNEYINSYTKLSFECKRGHKWKARFDTLLYYDCWCRKCQLIELHDKMYKTICKFVKSKNGTVLISRKDYINSNMLIPVRCKNGHTWNMNYGNSVILGRWCPICNGGVLLNEHQKDKLRKEIISKLFSLKYSLKSPLSSIKSCESKFNVSCDKNHIFTTSLSRLRSSRRCPFCEDSVGERYFRLSMQKLFASDFNTVRPKWLKINQGRCEIDGFNENLGLGFEYQGEQHFSKVDLFHRNKTLEEIIETDRKKRIIFNKRGLLILEPTYKLRLEDFDEFILKAVSGTKFEKLVEY